MPNIVLSRIDKALVLAKVSEQWIDYSYANTIIVANDVIASDLLQQSILRQITASLLWREHG